MLFKIYSKKTDYQKLFSSNNPEYTFTSTAQGYTHTPAVIYYLVHRDSGHLNILQVRYTLCPISKSSIPYPYPHLVLSSLPIFILHYCFHVHVSDYLISNISLYVWNLLFNIPLSILLQDLLPSFYWGVEPYLDNNSLLILGTANMFFYSLICLLLKENP